MEIEVDMDINIEMEMDINFKNYAWYTHGIEIFLFSIGIYNMITLKYPHPKNMP